MRPLRCGIPAGPLTRVPGSGQDGQRGGGPGPPGDVTQPTRPHPHGGRGSACAPLQASLSCSCFPAGTAPAAPPRPLRAVASSGPGSRLRPVPAGRPPLPRSFQECAISQKVPFPRGRAQHRAGMSDVITRVPRPLPFPRGPSPGPCAPLPSRAALHPPSQGQLPAPGVSARWGPLGSADGPRAAWGPTPKSRSVGGRIRDPRVAASEDAGTAPPRGGPEPTARD